MHNKQLEVKNLKHRATKRGYKNSYSARIMKDLRVSTRHLVWPNTELRPLKSLPYTVKSLPGGDKGLLRYCVVILFYQFLTRPSSWRTRHFLFVRQRSGMTCLLTVVLQLVSTGSFKRNLKRELFYTAYADHSRY